MKLCQILLFPVLLAFIDKVNSSSGCDLDSAIADGCSGLTECTLSNGYATGECCQPDHLCDLEEGDCDRDEDCDGNYICGTNNCGSPFPDSHDCCTRACSNYVTEKDTWEAWDNTDAGKTGTLSVEFSKDVESWTIEVTFDAPIISFTVWDGTNIACSDSTCTFDNQDYNGVKSAGETLDIDFLYYFDSSSEISDVSISGDAFCTT